MIPISLKLHKSIIGSVVVFYKGGSYSSEEKKGRNVQNKGFDANPQISLIFKITFLLIQFTRSLEEIPITNISINVNKN